MLKGEGKMLKGPRTQARKDLVAQAKMHLETLRSGQFPEDTAYYFRKIQENLEAAGATPEDIGTSTEELMKLQRDGFVAQAKKYLETLRSGQFPEDTVYYFQKIQENLKAAGATPPMSIGPEGAISPDDITRLNEDGHPFLQEGMLIVARLRGTVKEDVIASAKNDASQILARLRAGEQPHSVEVDFRHLREDVACIGTVTDIGTSEEELAELWAKQHKAVAAKLLDQLEQSQKLGLPLYPSRAAIVDGMLRYLEAAGATPEDISTSTEKIEALKGPCIRPHTRTGS